MKGFVLVFVLSAAALAQCPIKINVAHSSSCHTTSFKSNANCNLHINYENRSDRAIEGVKFGLNYYDSVGDKASGPEYYASKKTLRPGKKYDAYWFNPEHAGYGHEAWVQKVLFADGSTWEDDGSRVCKLRYKIAGDKGF